mmetsp:Transcript_1859/g.1950  ORF Transcript_1859/g.1950 Transcript_1859/m.1950 type:complete len:181 (-) Transcript_1859:177-719(-)
MQPVSSWFFVSAHGPAHTLKPLNDQELWREALSKVSQQPSSTFAVEQIHPSGYSCLAMQLPADTAPQTPLTRWSGCNAAFGPHTATLIIEEVRTVQLSSFPSEMTVEAVRDACQQTCGVQFLTCTQREDQDNWLMEATVRGTDVSVLESWSGSVEDAWPHAAKVSVRPIAAAAIKVGSAQ